MEIKIIKEPISRDELQGIADEQFGDFVKAVVDVERGIMAIGGELHADEEAVLVEEENSKREHTWGVNLYPKESEEGWIEFNSMVNLKPSQGNRTRGVESQETREKIARVVHQLVKD